MTKKEVELWTGRARVAVEDLWWFLIYFVHTKDEHDATTNYKRFPKKAMYRFIARVYLESNVLFIEKSRQIMMTWLFSAIILWMTLFTRNQLNMYQSKKQEDANKIIERSKHIYDGLTKIWPFNNLPKAKTTGDKIGTTTKFEIPGKMSKIEAIAQGPDIIRMNTCSNILSDEIAHQVNPGEAYAAAKPTLSNGGRFVGMGTPNGRVFNYQMMYGIDRKTGGNIGENIIDSNYIYEKRFVAPDNMSKEQQRYWIENKIVSMPDEEFNSIPLDELAACMPGLRYWVTADGISCLRVHYSADPDKSPDTQKGIEWIRNERKGMSSEADWNREYEISYDTYEGKPVISNWQRDIFVKSLNYNNMEGIKLAVDFGTGTACVAFAQFVPLPNFNFFQLRILDEIVLRNSNTDLLAQLVVNKMKNQYKRAWDQGDVKCFPDPAGNQARETTSDNSMNTSIKIFKAYGIKCASRKLGIVDSTAFTRTVFAQTSPNGDPAVLIDPRCEYLISVLGGGWHYPNVDDGIHTGKPEKDGYFDHGGDTIRHLVNNTFSPKDLGQRKVNSGYKIVKIYQKGTGRPIGTRRVFVG